MTTIEDVIRVLLENTDEEYGIEIYRFSDTIRFGVTDSEGEQIAVYHNINDAIEAVKTGNIPYNLP